MLSRAGQGDPIARQRLLGVYRDRLRRMVEVRIDRRLNPRIDASDVVQEAIIDADRALDDYLRRPPMPFYPWLRRFAWDRLLKLHRFHIAARKRSVDREAWAAAPVAR